jgi:3-deoxy-manno-octulosonate cytidylyltransferase (CMP-KDO synthetase)
MKAVGIIPARYASSRFPGKALALLGGRPLIQHVYERAAEAETLSLVAVATDDERIAAVVRDFGGKVVMTSPRHASGTDRVAEAARDLDVDVVVNIQGDEPFVSPAVIDQAVAPFRSRPELAMSTLSHPITDESSLQDPNVVKVVTDQHGYALYFSRSLIPYPRRGEQSSASAHIGLYAYRKGFLLRFAAMPPGRLEQIEALEQLRVLENGDKILVIPTDDYIGIGVDVPADLERAEGFLARLTAST